MYTLCSVASGWSSYYATLLQETQVAIGEITAFDVVVKDELLHNTSAVFATEGELRIQVSCSCDNHMINHII